MAIIDRDILRSPNASLNLSGGTLLSFEPKNSLTNHRHHLPLYVSSTTTATAELPTSTPSPYAAERPPILQTEVSVPISDTPRRPENTHRAVEHRPRQQRRWSARRSLFNGSRTSNPRKSEASTLWNPINTSSRIFLRPSPSRAPGARRPEVTGSGYPEGGDEYPLLTLPEQRRSRRQSTPKPLFLDRSIISGAESSRTSLPRSSVRRTRPRQGVDGMERDPDLSQGAATTTTATERGADRLSVGGGGGGGGGGAADQAHLHEDASTDLEQGHPPHHTPPGSHSNRSPYPASAPTSHHIPTPDPPDDYAWGPSHPCFPHPNPHVPLSSPLFATTRIIRIKRDWMIAGDQAPTFSNLYPEILEPVLAEGEFRSIVKHVNEELVAAFDPWGWRNWLDALLGVCSGWVWEDVGWTGTKGRLRGVEGWLEEWNLRVGGREGVRVVGLRRTGYLSLDIQIPDPHVGVVGVGPDSRPPTANLSRPVTKSTTAGGLEPRVEGLV